MVQPPVQCCLWGQEQAPKNYTGLVGDLQDSRTDVAWANLFIQPKRAQLIDYTAPYRSDYICFVVRRINRVAAKTHQGQKHEQKYLYQEILHLQKKLRLQNEHLRKRTDKNLGLHLLCGKEKNALVQTSV